MLEHLKELVMSTKDKLLAEKLMNDPKEVNEHVMLVDLRNDLAETVVVLK